MQAETVFVFYQPAHRAAILQCHIYKARHGLATRRRLIVQHAVADCARRLGALGRKVGGQIHAPAIDFVAGGAAAAAKEQRLAGMGVAGQLRRVAGAAGQALDIGHGLPDIVRRKAGEARHLGAGHAGADGLEQVEIVIAMAEIAGVEGRAAAAGGARAMAGRTGSIEHRVAGRDGRWIAGERIVRRIGAGLRRGQTDGEQKNGQQQGRARNGQSNASDVFHTRFPRQQEQDVSGNTTL
jgi:hypothetical protein